MEDVAVLTDFVNLVNLPDSDSDDEEPPTPERMSVKPSTIQTTLKAVSGQAGRQAWQATPSPQTAISTCESAA